MNEKDTHFEAAFDVEASAKAKRQMSTKELNAKFALCLSNLKHSSLNLSDSYIIAAAMTETFDILCDADNRSSRLLIYDKKNDVYIDLEPIIDIKYCSKASAIISSKKSLDSLSRDVVKHIKSMEIITGHNAREYREPPRHLLKLRDGVFDVKRDEYVGKEYEDDYHFTNRLNFTRNRAVDAIDIALIERIFKHDWSNDDPELYMMRLNILRCVIEGDSKGVAFINLGSGGNGKSTFNEFARHLVPGEYIVDMNIHDFDSTFALSDINSSTRLIIGDELAKVRISGKCLSTFKQVADRKTIKTEAKFQNAIAVKPNCVILQNSNSMPAWGESNNAIKARTVNVPWPETDFRSMLNAGLIDDMNPDDLMNDEKFMNSLFNHVLNMTSYFTRFPVPKHIKSVSDSMIDQTDNVKTFIDYLVESEVIGHTEILPTSVVYEQYLAFLRVENPSAKPMSRRAFANRFIDEMKRFGYEIMKRDGKNVTVRITTLDYLRWDRSVIEFTTNYRDLDEMLDKKRSVVKSNVLVNPSLAISKSEVDEVRKLVHDNAELELTSRIERILRYLVNDVNDVIVASIYKDI